MKKVGIKYDNGKLRWGLLPYDALSSVVRVMMAGSKKYSDFNWQKIDDIPGRYFDACMRHLTQWRQGETIDGETGESHLSHAVCCLLFMIWA